MKRTNQTGALGERNLEYAFLRHPLRRKRFPATVFLATILFTCLSIFVVHAANGSRPDDVEIVAAIEAEMLYDDAVSAQRVDVRSVGGVVTLEGTVENLLAKQRAIRVAESIRGVRSIVNNLEVPCGNRSDSTLLSDASYALVLDPVTEKAELDVNVEEGTATLTGKVQSWVERTIAAQNVRSVKGICRLENRIDVSYSGERDDAEIAEEIRKRLKYDPYVIDHLLSVEVKGGVVTLEGKVASLEQKALARTDALVPGVDSVALNVEIDEDLQLPLQRKSKHVIIADEEIADAVELALELDARTRDSDISVEVENGIVTLSGTVPGLSSKNAAIQDAYHTIGVGRVQDQIKVRPGELRSDEKIGSDIRRVFGWHPAIERHEIDVTVRNGKAFLYGKVDSRYERGQALQAASTIPGVAEVDNRIVVRNGRWEHATDYEITKNIERELRRDWLVDEEDITLRVVNNLAVIEGELQGRRELRRVVENAFDGGAEMVRVTTNINGVPHTNFYHYYDVYETW